MIKLFVNYAVASICFMFNKKVEVEMSGVNYGNRQNTK